MIQKGKTSQFVWNEISHFLYERMDNRVEINQRMPSFLISENMKIESLDYYLKRFKHFCQPEGSTLLISIIYIDRFCEMSHLKLTIQNIQKIFLISIVLAIKYNEDSHFNNETYAKVGGINLCDLNKLESIFLNTVGFNMNIKTELYTRYFNFFDTLIISKQN